MNATPGRERCPRCERPRSSCYCAQLHPVANCWPVWICQHPAESRHALGTARIAALGLEHSVMMPCPGAANPSLFPDSPITPALIYPGEAAKPIDELQAQTERPLLFLDATWRKSHRMLMESPWLQSLPRYALENRATSRYRIRRASRPDALSTLEAIVETLGVVEGDAQRYAPLLAVMDHLIDQQIAHMGTEVYARNYRKG
ncbi:MAG: DTW domain-containing protein [Pseudomonadales bacterium]|nr:DTW domain-containing protein [Pseudomonadales bacterium]